MADESLFQITPDGVPEESSVDSKWAATTTSKQHPRELGRDSLYVAVEGFIFNNNTMLFFDTHPCRTGRTRADTLAQSQLLATGR